MKPCDCKDQQDTDNLKEQGIGINDWSMTVKPAVVQIDLRHFGLVQVPMSVMKKFAEWYLRDQDYECDCANGCASSKCDKR